MTRAQRYIKRTFDVLTSSLALVLLSPLFLIVAVLITINSPGPVFFRQDRVGKNGKIFKLLKFRTMATNAESLGYSVQEIRQFEIAGHDPRVNRFNKFLRDSAFDEIPQLINVVAGDISLVGPRPFIPARIKSNEVLGTRYEGIKPGLTSLVFIKAGTNASDQDIIKLDLEYAQRQNFWLDVQILCQTVIKIIFGKLRF